MIANRNTILWIVVVILTFPVPVVRGAEVEGVEFDDDYLAESHRLTLRGTGLFRYLGFVKAYVGALYVAEGEAAEDVLADVAKRLEVEYFHAIAGEDFGPATNKIIAQNVDSETLEKLRPRIEYHNALYRDVQPGDRYALTYLPGRGTELALNGEPLGIIPGADFASAIYAMWLGEAPMNRSFKQQLLGVR
jgi:hypothetical protein